MLGTARGITRLTFGLAISLFVLVFLLAILSPPAQASAPAIGLSTSASAPSSEMPFHSHHGHCREEGSVDPPTVSSDQPPASGESGGSQNSVTPSQPPRPSPLCKVLLASVGSLAAVGVFGLSRLWGAKAR